MSNESKPKVMDLTLLSSGPATLRVELRCAACLSERAAIFDSQQRLVQDCQWCRHCQAEQDLTDITQKSGLFRQLPTRHRDDICETCRGCGEDCTREGTNKSCDACDGTGNGKVTEAATGDAKCGKRIGRCGGTCVRQPLHAGLCLCQGDSGTPESCPA